MIMHEDDYLQRLLGGIVFVVGGIAVLSWSILMSVGWWYHGTGIARVDGRYLLGKGNLVIDPGQTFGFILYVISWVSVGSTVVVLIAALALFIHVERVEEFRAVFRREDLDAYRKFFNVAALTIAVPFIVQLVSWACQLSPQ